MANYSFTCTCGHVMTMDANNREDAIGKFKAAMTQQALDDHIRTHGPNDPRPTLEQAHAAIEQTVTAAA
jgi:hypothetical protein